MGAGEYIKDFVRSKDKRFEGKSKKERARMALGAYYGAKRADESEDLSEVSGPQVSGALTDRTEKNKVKNKIRHEKILSKDREKYFDEIGTWQKNVDAAARAGRPFTDNELKNTIPHMKIRNFKEDLDESVDLSKEGSWRAGGENNYQDYVKHHGRARKHLQGMIDMLDRHHKHIAEHGNDGLVGEYDVSGAKNFARDTEDTKDRLLERLMPMATQALSRKKNLKPVAIEPGIPNPTALEVVHLRNKYLGK
jgi:hypothetical protein